MKDSAKPTGENLSSELGWRIAILASLALTVPILRHGGQAAQPPAAVAQSAATGGRSMAGFLPGVAPITFGHTLHVPSDARS